MNGLLKLHLFNRLLGDAFPEPVISLEKDQRNHVDSNGKSVKKEGEVVKGTDFDVLHEDGAGTHMLVIPTGVEGSHATPLTY